MQTQQAPEAPAPLGAPAAPVATGAPQPGTITIVGSDGVTKTIVLPNSSPVIARVAEQAAARAAERASGSRGSSEFAPGVATGVTLSLMAFAVLSFWRRYKRRGMPVNSPQGSSESPQRLERMERGIEAIAIEVERVSEGQRFVTNLLAESRQPTAIETK